MRDNLEWMNVAKNHSFELQVTLHPFTGPVRREPNLQRMCAGILAAISRVRSEYTGARVWAGAISGNREVSKLFSAEAISTRNSFFYFPWGQYQRSTPRVSERQIADIHTGVVDLTEMTVIVGILWCERLVGNFDRFPLSRVTGGEGFL